MPFDLPMFPLIHVVMNVPGAIAWLVSGDGLMAGARMDGGTAFFLLTAILASAAGCFLPFTKILPSHVTGAKSLVVLAACLPARYGTPMEGGWRRTCAVSGRGALSQSRS